jgi:hypothetical protein
MEPGSISSEVAKGDLLAAYGKMSRDWADECLAPGSPMRVKTPGFRVLLVLAGIYREVKILCRGDVMDAKAIAESGLIILIVVTGGALVPDLLRYIKVGHVKYGRRATDL